MEQFLQEIMDRVPEVRGLVADVYVFKGFHVSVFFCWANLSDHSQTKDFEVPTLGEVARLNIPFGEGPYMVGLPTERSKVAQGLRDTGRFRTLSQLRCFFLGEHWAVWEYNTTMELYTKLNLAHREGYQVQQIIPDRGSRSGCIALSLHPRLS